MQPCCNALVLDLCSPADLYPIPRYYVGIVLFFFFSFFTLFVFLTMLFGLIGDAYDQAKDEAAEAEKQVGRLVHEDTPAVKALMLKMEGYFEHFRSIDNLDGSKDGPTESADSDSDSDFNSDSARRLVRLHDR